MNYLSKLPHVIPGDMVLVHNHVRPTRRLGSHGFRAWLTAPDSATFAICGCGWAPERGQHFRVILPGALASYGSEHSEAKATTREENSTGNAGHQR